MNHLFTLWLKILKRSDKEYKLKIILDTQQFLITFKALINHLITINFTNAKLHWKLDLLESNPLSSMILFPQITTRLSRYLTSPSFIRQIRSQIFVIELHEFDSSLARLPEKKKREHKRTIPIHILASRRNLRSPPSTPRCWITVPPERAKQHIHI